MNATRFQGLTDELEDLVPAPEPEPTDEDEALLEEIRDQARAFLGISKHASLEAIQEGFYDIELFWDFFLPHYREDPDTGEATAGAPFHADLRDRWGKLVRGELLRSEDAVACPREHSKSVNGSLLVPIYSAANGFRKFIVLFSDTSDQAEGFLADIQIELETNERLQAIYPALCTFVGLPRNNRLIVGEQGNEVIFRAVGSGKSVRGARRGARRPDLIVLDDIENDEEVENPKRRRKKTTWYNKVVRKLGRAAVYLIVGTILHADSFLAKRIRSKDDIYRAVAEYPARMDLWQEWERVFHDRGLPDREAAALALYEEHRTEMDAGAEVLWPTKFSLYELMVERAEDLASFLSERQNDPFDPAGSYFPEDSLQFLERDDMPADDQIRFSVLFWDPSRGTSKSDTSAAPRLDVLLDGRRVVSEAVVGQIPPEQVMESIVGMHKRRGFLAIGVEKVALSSYDEQFVKLAREQSLALPIEPVTPKGDKSLRIRSQRPLVMSGTLLFAESLPLEAKQQIKYFGQHPNDDVWDAIQQANALADALMTDVEPAMGVRESDPEDTRIDRESMFGERLGTRPVMGEHIGMIERAWA